jgi:hypothetical protein
LVAEFPQGLGEFLSTVLSRLRGCFHSLLDVADAVMENLPNQSAQPVGNRPEGSFVAGAGFGLVEHALEMTPLFLDGRLCCLRQNPSQKPDTLRGSGTAIVFGAFLAARDRPHPGGPLRRAEGNAWASTPTSAIIS